MGYIGQDEEEELTTERGCFNCARFKNCPHIESEKRRGRDFKAILEDNGEEFRYGCSCTNGKWGHGEPKERVQFT